MSDDQTVTDALNRLDQKVNAVAVSVTASDLAIALVHVERLRAEVKKLRNAEEITRLNTEIDRLRGEVARLDAELGCALQTSTTRGDLIDELRATIERLSA